MNYKSFILVTVIYFTFAESLNIISRNDWGAKSSSKPPSRTSQVPYVVIHHTADPPACTSSSSCKSTVQSIQRNHLKKWSDIGYNFLIGGDGNIYEGRGFNVIGAHAPKYNSKSLGICFIGNWSNSKPSQIMLDQAKSLISYGVEKGYIKKEFKVVGHRQLKATACPGNALFNEIQNWNHFSTKI